MTQLTVNNSNPTGLIIKDIRRDYYYGDNVHAIVCPVCGYEQFRVCPKDGLTFICRGNKCNFSYEVRKDGIYWVYMFFSHVLDNREVKGYSYIQPSTTSFTKSYSRQY